MILAQESELAAVLPGLGPLTTACRLERAHGLAELAELPLPPRTDRGRGVGGQEIRPVQEHGHLTGGA